MSAGRRGLLLSVAFFGLALWLCPSHRAQAQLQIQPIRPVDPGAGRHTPWGQNLTPEQIRQRFAQFGQGDNNDANKLLEDLLRDSVLKKNPNADPKQVDSAIKKLLADKEFMNRVTDLAQKHKNQKPDEMPRLTPEDLAKLKNARPKGMNGDPFKVPKFDPDQLPKFDPNKFDPDNFDPEEFPHADPKNPPRIDPDTKLPLDPRTAKPFDPRTGKPLDPNTGLPPVEPKFPPKIDDPALPPIKAAEPPKIDAKPPQALDPNTGRPVNPADPDTKRKFDPENPLGTPKNAAENMAKAKAVETATALWEKNVGPIDESPAVKRAILDLVTDQEAMDALTDAKGNNLFDMFKDTGDGDGLKDLFGGLDTKGWEWPKLDWKLDFGKSTPNVETPATKSRWPETGSSRWPSGSSMGGMGSFNFGGAQVPWLLVLILLAVIVAAVVYWKWEVLLQLSRAKATVVGGLGPWPIDPREINTREDVVKAFEYVSVLICGPAAKTWTHSTIADELTALAATHGETAMKLARLYELARYAPLDEPLTRVEVLEARRLVCDLAGMD